MERWYHKNMNPLNYLHLQLRLEGKALVRGYFMRQVKAVPGEEMPLMLITQLADKEPVIYYDEAISLDLQNELAASLREIKFPNLEAALGVLQKHNVIYEVGHYKTYLFPLLPVSDKDVLRLSKDDPNVKAFGFEGFAEQVYAIEHDGNIVSACVSTRENEECGEAWVYTIPEYRHQGFAQKVVSAWAAGLMDVGKIPFYSHKLENTASANLAGKLGMQLIFEEISITRS